MKFKMIIDKTKDEEVVATVHTPSALTQELEALVMRHAGCDKLPAYTEDEMKLLPFSDIECITILEGKTVAIDRQNKQYRLKLRLYELEDLVPAYFIRINKSHPGKRNPPGALQRILQRSGRRDLQVRLPGICIPPLLRGNQTEV